MTATLRVMLDQLVAPTSPDLAEASAALAHALAATAPRGAEVSAIVPRGEGPDIPELAGVTRLTLPRREIAAAWQLGMVTGVGGGMIHSPTLLAPLVRHDRVHETHQIVPTLWELRAWEDPASLARADVLWQRAMLKRAVAHADAVVVPTHAAAARLAEIAPKIAGRIRVIAGAPADGFRVPSDAAGRLRTLGVPDRFGLVVPAAADADAVRGALAALAPHDLDVVVLADAATADAAAVADLAAAGGVALGRVHSLAGLDRHDRAALLSQAAVVVAPAGPGTAWPWRVVEAVAAGAVLVAADTAVHREVVADAGLLVGPGETGDAVAAAVGAAASRLRVLAGDRAAAFSWREAAERVWQLHAEL